MILKDYIIMAISALFTIFLMAFLPVIRQYKSGILNEAFKRIKIKKLAFLFRAPSGASVSKDGIAIPVFVEQIIGYVLSVLTLITDLILLIVLEDPTFIIPVASIGIFFAELLFILILWGAMAIHQRS